MKYCPKCKLRMPTESTDCRQCGGTLRTVGGEPSGEPAAAGDDADSALTMQLQGLQHEVRRSRKSMMIAGAAALALCALFVVLTTGLHLYRVLQYAEVSQVDVRLSGVVPGEAEIRFVRRDAGKVEFVRESAGRSETLIDHGYHDFHSQSPEQQFVWAGPDGGDFTIRVRTRDGWKSEERVWVTRDGRVQRVDESQ